MELNQLSIVTMTWARTPDEEQLLKEALPILSALNIPVYVADGGSGNDFIHFLNSLENFVVLQPLATGLWNQVQTSIQAAQQSKAPFLLYTEPDKARFFETELIPFLQNAPVNENTGVVLASRSDKAMNTFPAFQQSTEHTINFCCAEVIGQPYDYSYGPFIFNRNLVPFLQTLPPEINWGWRPYTFCKAHLLGMQVTQMVGDNECPPNQRSDDARERIYRMNQLQQSVQGVVLATR